MPSVYIGYLALGAVLAEFWNGEAPFWETCAILVAIFPVFVVGIGHIAIIYKPSFIPSRFYAAAGIPTSLILVLIYALLLRRTRTASRFVVGAFLTISFALFVYYLPVWLGTPITRNGYYARMWLEGPGLRNWI